MRADLQSHLEMVFQQRPAPYHAQRALQPDEAGFINTQVTAGVGP